MAEGKIRVALNKGVQVPDGCLIDPQGRPTTDPKTFYGPPPGAILPFGGHKGFGLGVVARHPRRCADGQRVQQPVRDPPGQRHVDRPARPRRIRLVRSVRRRGRRFLDYLSSSAKTSPDAEILMPGEIEERNRVQRSREGIELDETTWGQILATARLVGLSDAEVAKAAG